MKGLQKFAALCTSVVLGACGMGSVFAQPMTVNAATESTVPEGFVYVDGTHFMCDGEPFYFAGCNSYDMFTLGDGSSNDSTEAIETKFMNKEAIDARMQQMEDNGVRVLRTWGFSNETWHGFELAPGEYNEAEFMLFDYIMYSAQQHNIRVIITLENYWEAYGGIDKKLSWAGAGSGGNHKSRAAYFTNETCKQWYKDYAKHFAERTNYFTGVQYKDDPTVFAWDLMNEPRYQDAGEDSTGLTLRAWVDEMGAYIKEVDPNHMVYAGLEGHGIDYGFGGDEGNPFVYIQQSPYIDFCSAHPYPDEHWANMTPEDTKNTMVQWIEDAHQEVGKPFVVTEFNVHSSLPEAEYEDYWKAVFDTIEEYDAAGGLFWEFNDRKLSEFTVMDGDPILTYFQQHAARMEDKTPMNSLYTKNTVVDKDAPIDVLLSYEMQSGTVTGLQLDGTTLTAGTDYEQTEDTITVSASVFSDVATGEHTIQLLTSEGNQPKVKIRVYSAAEEAQKRSVIDDFESYGEDAAIGAAYTTNANGDSLKISLDAEHAKNGSYAMKYEYSVADGGAGYCGATKKLSNADWTGFDGIHFWILSDGSNRDTTFQFVDGAGAYWESIQHVTAETGWQEVKIPFSDFHVQQWGTAAETPTLNGVSEYSIYTGQNGNPGTGVWYFDDIGLYRTGSTTTTTTTTTGTTTTTTTTTTTAETTSMETEATTDSETTTVSETTTTTTTTTATVTETTSMETEATTDSETTTVSETTTTTTDADTDINYGDVNLDGKVDLMDVIMMNKYLAGQITLSEQATKNADVNADGSLGDGDSTTLMRFVLMIIPNLPHVE